jgi:hypothetical protein
MPLQASPTVFLCYVNEDQEKAENLSQQLETVGIKIWDKIEQKGRIDGVGSQQLPFLLQNKIVEFLTSLPNMNDHNALQALSFKASLDNQLHKNLNFSLPQAQFFQSLVPALSEYGSLNDGRNALKAALEAAKDFVGGEKRAHCDTLIRELEFVRFLGRAIEQEVDYVVVLQSFAMMYQYERGELSEELHQIVQTALERQKDFRPGISFIIPARIENCQDLRAFQDLSMKTIDISDEQNVNSIIRHIKRDQQRRKRR